MTSLPGIYRLSSSLMNKLLLGVTYRILSFFSKAHAERCSLHVMWAISSSVSYKVTHVSFQRKSQTVRPCFLNRCLESWGRTISVLTRALYFLAQKQCFVFTRMQIKVSGGRRCVFIEAHNLDCLVLVLLSSGMNEARTAHPAGTSGTPTGKGT